MILLLVIFESVETLVETKIVFGVDRRHAEYPVKLIGHVDPEAVKHDSNTGTQIELSETLGEQWIDRLRFQHCRQVTVATQDGQVVSLRTFTIPTSTATDEQVERIRRERMA